MSSSSPAFCFKVRMRRTLSFSRSSLIVPLCTACKTPSKASGRLAGISRMSAPAFRAMTAASAGEKWSRMACIERESVQITPVKPSSPRRRSVSMV